MTIEVGSTVSVDHNWNYTRGNSNTLAKTTSARPHISRGTRLTVLEKRPCQRGPFSLFVLDTSHLNVVIEGERKTVATFHETLITPISPLQLLAETAE